ncbi:MAG: radical SAM protein [Nanoarchaeota archaeon]|nr:radical SAM protein [Nanoarchaeota archaeon]
MKIALISPKHSLNGVNIGLGYLNRQLCDCGHKTLLLDFGVTNNISVSDAISKFRPDYVLVSVSEFTLKEANTISREVRHVSKCIIVAGGPLLNMDYHNFLRLDSFDFGIVGDGRNISAMLKDLTLPGHVYVKGKLVFTGKAEGESIDSLAAPLYNEEIYGTFRSRKFSYIMMTSRGCPYHCIFCPNPLLSGKKWIARSPENVIEEIRSLHFNHGIDTFNIMDDNFSLDKTRAKVLLKKVLQLPFKVRYILGNGLRADTIDDELAELLKVTGCLRVPIGVENADPKIHKLVEKGVSLKIVEKAIITLKKHRLNTEAFMIIGLINEDKSSLLRSLEFIKNMNITARWYIAMPMPGTVFYEWVKANGKLLPFKDNAGTWSGDPPVLFETDKLGKKELLHYFYYLNSESGNYFFLSTGSSMMMRLVTALKNLAVHNPARMPSFFVWCILAGIYGKDFVFNQLEQAS